MLLFLSLFPFLVMTGIEPRASRTLDKCSNTELQSQPFGSFSIESFSFLKAGRSQWETPRFCSRRTKSNPVPYLSRKTFSIHSPYVLSLVAVKEALLWGRDTPNLEMLHGESLVNKEKAAVLSSFSKKSSVFVDFR